MIALHYTQGETKTLLLAKESVLLAWYHLTFEA